MQKLLIPLLLIALVCTSCNESSVPKEGSDNPSTTYRISLGMGGEILDVGESPLLTKAPTDNIYGIQIYSKAKAEDSYTTYHAYGLFDHADNITVDLPSDKLYKFDVTMVVDGKNVLAVDEGKFRHPFLISGIGGGSAGIGNSFITSSTAYLNYLNQGQSYVNEIPMSATYKRPHTDRYYGTISDYKPTSSGKVSIFMKRAVFGVKIIPTGFTDGKLRITMTSSPDIVMTYGTDAEITKIITFQNDLSGSRWIDDDYTESTKMNIIWERNGTELPLVSNYTLTAKRKTLHTIKVRVSGPPVGGDTGFDITTEDDSLTEDGVIEM